MNCPQCQEQLDERLDEMRPALRSGALTPAAARAQAQTAFDAIVSDCPECESELRSHLQFRLALMTPDAEMAAVEVPPNIRLNVRRALEREQLPLPPPRRAWNPLKGFAWTGGAIVSAITLFVIARPFLIERAQQPYIPPSSNTDSSTPVPMVAQEAPATRVAPPAGTAKQAPPAGAVKQAPPAVAAKQAPRLGTGASKPSKPAIKPRVGAATPPSNETADMESPSFLEVAPPKIAVIPPAVTSREPRPKVGGSAPREFRPRLSPPPKRAVQKPSAPQPRPPVPVVGSSAPSGDYSNRAGASLPDESRLDPKVLAPSGKELGFVVRFVPPSGEVRANVRSAAPSAALRTSPKKPPESPVDPEALTPPTAPHAPADNSVNGTTAEKSSGGAGGTAGSVTPVVPLAAPTVTKGSLAISVKKEVANARVVGEIKGKEPKDTVLWSGKASAGQSIPVPLEPLGAVKGDTVVISFQQKISPSETKTLATESVVVP